MKPVPFGQVRRRDSGAHVFSFCLGNMDAASGDGVFDWAEEAADAEAEHAAPSDVEVDAWAAEHGEEAGAEEGPRGELGLLGDAGGGARAGAARRWKAGLAEAVGLMTGAVDGARLGGGEVRGTVINQKTILN